MTWFHAAAKRRWLLSCLIVSGLLGWAASGGSGAAMTTVPLSPTAEAGEDGSSSTEVTTELPPPDLPTANEHGYTFELRSSLRADLEAVAREAAVYELRREKVDLESATALAKALGLTGEVVDRNDGTFEASGGGQLFVSTELIQYFSDAETGDGDLPGDEEAIAFARDWLRTAGVLPPDLGDGRIVSRIDETNRLIVLFGPAEPANVLAAFPSISVTLGPEGTVLEASLRWARPVRADVYQLVPAEQAWQIVESGQAFLEVDLARAELEPGANVKGRATFSEISIAYSTSGPPGGQQFLQPIYVFTGRVRVEDVDGTFPIRAYVPALANTGAPVGFISPPGNV